MEFCEMGEHEWERVESVEWATKFEELNEQYETVAYRCAVDECEARRWDREEKPQEQEVLEWAEDG